MMVIQRCWMCCPAGRRRADRDSGIDVLLTHFESLSKGVIDLRDLLYFALLIGFFLTATSVALEARRGAP